MDESGQLLVPLLLFGALILEIVALCFRNWMEGYYGDVIALTLSPWRLCHLECLRCSGKKPKAVCFWMHDWSETGFESFGVVAQLEYWCLGLLIVALLVSILTWIQSNVRRANGCFVQFSRPAMLVFIVTSLLSTLSEALFAVKVHHGTSAVTTFDDIRLYFGWPCLVRTASGLLAWAATANAIWRQCRTPASAGGAPTANGTIMVVSTERDFDDDSVDDDDDENGALL